MHHAYLDKFASRDGPLHRRDPRAKAVAFISLLTATILTPVGTWWPFGVIAATTVVLWVISRTPPGYLLKRVVVLSPFVILSVALFPFLTPGPLLWSAPVGPWQLSISSPGLELAASLSAKYALSVIILGLLFSVTRFQHFLYALRRFRVPDVLVVQLGFLYRYLFVVLDEAERMQRARDARSAGRRGWLAWRGAAAAVGALFLRSYDRSRRVYWAMLARGFSGEIHILERLHFRAADAAFLVAVLLPAVLSAVFSLMGAGASPVTTPEATTP